MKTYRFPCDVRYMVLGSSMFDSILYDIPAMRKQLGGMIVRPRTKRFARNWPQRLTFALAQGITSRAVSEELGKLFGRQPLVKIYT